LIGVGTTLVLRVFVGAIVKGVEKCVPVPEPKIDLSTMPSISEQWRRMTDHPTGGNVVGPLERLLFFAAFWSETAWPIFASWFVLKTAFHWQGANFATFPMTAPNKDDFEWFFARRKVGTRHVAKLLVGTVAKALVALAGVAIGHSMTFA
jgi:hypothetical protein